MQSQKEQTCSECVRPNCNGQTHLTEDAYLGCSQCGIELNDIIELVENVFSRSNEQCQICDHQYDVGESPDDHFLSHFYESPAQVFLCLDCDSPPDDDEEKPKTIITLQFDCDICKEFSFTSSRLRNKHKFEVHGISQTRTEFKCRDCKAVFKSVSQLGYHRRRHLKKPPEKDPKFPCRICEDGEIYKTKAERGQHENEMHRDKKTRQFNCPFCERFYPCVSVLVSHLPKHTQKRNHTCEICGKSFGRLMHMEYHRSTHVDEKLYECFKCPSSKTFKTVNSLNLHVIRMHTDRPGYPCDMCDKVFKDTSDRRRHRYSHGIGEKKFECDVCSKKFYEAKLLRFHMKTHNKIRLVAAATDEDSSDVYKSEI